MSGEQLPVRLAGIEVPGGAAAWEALGFSVDGGAIAVANGAVFTGASQVGIVLDDTATEQASLEGVPIAGGRGVHSGEHANGALELDHIVLTTDSLDRTSTAVEAAWGLPQRRVRDTGSVRQAFHRFADADGARGCIVEIVERRGMESTTLWGLVVNVADLDAAVAAGDGLVGEAKEAVQPGRRIATVRREAGLPLAVALMSR